MIDRYLPIPSFKVLIPYNTLQQHLQRDPIK
jgi:hypothetical protein